MTLTETPNARRHRIRGKHWRTYKNRKKTIRQRFQAERITAEQRARLLAEARARYEQETETEAVRIALERVRRGQEYIANGGTVPRPDLLSSTPSSTECCAECVGAEGTKCRCACEGANHGAAMGTPPESVYVPALGGRPYHPDYVSPEDWTFG